MNSNKWVLVYEHISKPVKIVSSEKNDYILEGIFAEFDVTNENGRIYREKEYLPHLTYLLEKVKNRSLFGELDHPLDRFDVVLGNVSHIVESIEYDAKNKIIKGKIKLLDTVAGKNAKAIIDGGGTLSISSRAAGLVKENGEVEIKRIFAYDLVAEPGFKSAKLRKLNEELNLSTDRFLVLEYNDQSLSVYCNEDGCVLLDPVKESNSIIDVENNNKTSEINEFIKEFTDIKRFLDIDNNKHDSFIDLINKISYENTKDIREQISDVKSKLIKIERILENNKSDYNYDLLGKYKSYVGKISNMLTEKVEILDKKVKRNNRKYDLNIEKISSMLDKYNKDIKELKKLISSIKNRIYIQDHSYKDIISIVKRMENRINGINGKLSAKINNIDRKINKKDQKINNIVDEINKISLKNIKNNKKKSKLSYIKDVSKKYKLFGKKKENVNNIVKKVDEMIKSIEFDEFLDKETKMKMKKLYDSLSDQERKQFSSLPMNKKIDILNRYIIEDPNNGGDILNENLSVSDYSLYIPTDLVPIWEELNSSEKEKLLKILEGRNYTTKIEIEDFWKKVLTDYKNKIEILNDINLKELNLNENYVVNLINTIKQNNQ